MEQASSSVRNCWLPHHLPTTVGPVSTSCLAGQYSGFTVWVSIDDSSPPAASKAPSGGCYESLGVWRWSTVTSVHSTHRRMRGGPSVAAEHIQEPRHKTVVRARKARRAGCRWILRHSFVGLNSLNKKLEGNIKKNKQAHRKGCRGLHGCWPLWGVREKALNFTFPSKTQIFPEMLMESGKSHFF